MDYMKDKTDKADPHCAMLVTGSLVCSPGLYAIASEEHYEDIQLEAKRLLMSY
jgi:hypothetical protein